MWYWEEEYPSLLFEKDGDESVEVFMAGVDQGSVDKSTERWLDKIEDRLDYGKWYCGHYHTEKKIEKLEILFEDFDMLWR